MRKVLAITAITVAAAAGCGGDGGSTESFCEDLTEVRAHLDVLDQNDPQALDEAVAVLDDIDPPGEISDAYDNVLELYKIVADNDASVTDPDLATRFADLREDITKIEDFTTENCVDPRSENSDT